MNVLHVSNFLPEYHKIWGGAEQIALRTARLLKKSDINVSFCTSKFLKKKEENLDIYTVKNLKTYLGNSFVKIFNSLKTYGLMFDIPAYISFLSILKKTKPDVIHFHKFEEFSFSLICAANLRKIPKVVSIYDYFYFCPLETLEKTDGGACKKFNGVHCAQCIPSRRFSALRKFFLMARRNILKFFLSKIDAFIVLSESSEKILENYGIKKEKIFVIRQSFSTQEVIENNAGAKEKIVLFIGWVQARKGLHVIVEAMKEVVRNIKDAKLFVAGDAPDKEYEEKIKNSIRVYGLENNIFILGKLSYNEVKELFSKASVVVIAEQWENMSPAVLVEAMYYGKPVVAGKIGGAPEFINDGEDGFLVLHNCAAAFAEKIIKLLKDRKKAENIGRKAHDKIVKLFSEEETIGKLIGVYNELVHR